MISSRFVLPSAAFAVPLLLVAALSCGTEADQIGVGATCDSDDDCNQSVDPPLECLQGFTGGYCGLTDCNGDDDCPNGAICVAHEGDNYCFRACADKPECNANRPVEAEANCSSNVTLVDDSGLKACVPPSA